MAVAIVDKQAVQARLLDPHAGRMDRLRPRRRDIRRGLQQLPVVGLRPARHHVREVDVLFPPVPLHHPTALVWIDSQQHGRRNQFDVGRAVAVEVGDRPCDASVLFGPYVCGNEVPEGRAPDVRQVDTAEHAMPVGTVAFSGPQIDECPAPPRSRAQRVHFAAGAEHALVHGVDLRILHQELAPEPPGPLHHFLVGGRRQIRPPRRRHRRRLARRHRHQPLTGRFDCAKKGLHPPLLPAQREGAGPQAEFLAIVTHHQDGIRDPGTVIRRKKRPQIGQHVAGGLPRDQIPQALAAGEHFHRCPLFLGDEIACELFLAHPGRRKVGVVHDEILHTGGRERFGQVRLPHAFCQPEPGGSRVKSTFEVVGHHADLAVLVGIGNDGQDRFVVPTAQQFHLATGHQSPNTRDELALGSLEPIQERPAVVHGQADVRVTLQGFDHRQIRLTERHLKHLREVSHRLVVVDRQREDDAARHAVRSRRRSGRG